MVPLRPYLLVLVLAVIGPLLQSCEGANPTCVAPPMGAVLINLPAGMKAWWCPNPTTDKWNNIDRIFVSKCENATMVEEDKTCLASSSNTPFENCTTDTKPTLASSDTPTKLTPPNATEAAALYYQCTEDKALLSGLKGRLSQCIAGSWTPIHDLCDDACELPRDCSMVANLGFNESDTFSIIPSGEAESTVIEGTCELNETRGDTGWTVMLDILANTTRVDGFHKDDVITATDFHSLGFTALKSLNRELNNQSAPTVIRNLTMKVDIELEDGSMYFAEYSDVQLGDNLSLTAVGTYHGDAGDALKNNVGQAQDALWWSCPPGTNCSSITWGTLTWGPLTNIGSTIIHIKVYVRPSTFDAEVACPVQFGLLPWWEPGTMVNISTTRSEGATLDYTCGPYMEESGGTVGGTVTCTNSGGTLVWDKSPGLPCVLVCPTDEYSKTTDGSTCVLPATEAATDGVKDAALKCHEKDGGSLMLVTDVAHLVGISETDYYYTGHVHNSGVFNPAPPQNLTCDVGEEECTPTTDLACMAVKGGPAGSGKYHFKAIKCDDNTTRYLCQFPAKCPTNFTAYDGICYNVASSYSPLTNFADALTHCASMGAALAYPLTPGTLTILDRLVRADANFPADTEVNVLLGTNDKYGNFTVSGKYNPDDNLVTAAGTSLENKTYRVLNIPANHTASATLVADAFVAEAENVLYAVCQLHGPTGCWTDPPDAPTNGNRTWDNATILDTTITYFCYPGYFVGGDMTKETQTLSCKGQLGGWLNLDDVNQPLQACVAVNVCNAPAAASSEAITNTTSDNPLYLNGTTNFTCPAPMATQSLNTTQVLTCMLEGTMYALSPATVEACDACLGEPSVTLATTDWANSTTYSVGDTVKATCNSGHEVGFQEGNQTVECEADTGWKTVPACYVACTDGLPIEGVSMTKGNFTNNTVGTEIKYTCAANLHVLLNGSTSLVNETVVTCGADGNWTASGTYPDCLHYCQDTPSAVNASTNWTSTSQYVDGAMVVATCAAGYTVGINVTTQNMTCSTSGWTASATPCYKGCLSDPPAAGPNMTMADFTNNSIGANLTYTCTDDYMVVIDIQAGVVSSTNLTCLDSGEWSRITTFPACGSSTTSLPALDPNTTVFEGATAPYAPGSVVTVKCAPDMTSITGSDSTTATYDGTTWIMAEPTFLCRHITVATVPPPAGKHNLAPPNLDNKYFLTATYYWPTPNVNMSDSGGNDGNIGTDKGPFGFGNAVVLNSLEKQCRVHSDYNLAIDNCSSNPSNCVNGFSMSVWYMKDSSAEITNEMFTDPLLVADPQDHPEKIKTIFSTGGDMKGHPGVHIYTYMDLNLVAVVSTGKQYWHTGIIGMLVNKWENIGIKWDAINGMKVYLNTVDELGDEDPTDVPAADVKAPLEPAEMMLGCHRDSTKKDYRHHADGKFDELAIWTKKVDDSTMFYGGFNPEIGDASEDDLLYLSSIANLKDPSTYLAMMDAITSSSNGEEEETPDPTQSPTASTQTQTQTLGTQSSPTAASPTTATSTMATPEATKSFKVSLGGILTLTTGEVPDSFDPSMYKNMMMLVDLNSNLMKKSNKNNFLATQAEKDNPGSAGVMENYNARLMVYLQILELDSNDTKDGFTHEVTAANAYMKSWKRDLKELRQEGQSKLYAEAPNCTKMNNDPVWSYQCDRAAVSHAAIPNRKECLRRVVNIVITYSKTYNQFAHMKVNYARVSKTRPLVLDSRTLSVNMTCDPDPDAPEDEEVTSLNLGETRQIKIDLCQPTAETLVKHPVMLKFYHLQKGLAIHRKLKFHSGADVKRIERRYCVWWNKDQGDFGEWDPWGCRVLKTNAHYTRCACGHLGTYAVMMEKVELKVVPAEQLWLTILRYIGYIVSFLCIILYIVMVAISSDLRDQFHLMGLNTAIAVLIGAAFMLVSDIHAVRDDRHACTAIGTIIHFAYQAAGAWIFSLGYASFEAITSGVIGGRLRVYIPISWGLPLITVGATYTWFLMDLGEDPRCFISWENPAKFIFFGLQMIFVFFSMLSAIIVLTNLATPALRKDNLVDDYGSFCRGAAFVMLFFDITWIFGLLCYLRLGFTDPDFYPIFQVMNSWTGLVIFLFIGLGSRRFKMAIAGQTKVRREMLKGYAFGKPKASQEDKQKLSPPVDHNKGDVSPLSPSKLTRPHSSASGYLQRPPTVAGRRPLSAR